MRSGSRCRHNHAGRSSPYELAAGADVGLPGNRKALLRPPLDHPLSTRFTITGQHRVRYIRYPMLSMHSLFSLRARRTPALIASLALFLLGSNYCVLGALVGDTRMACLTVPGDASSAAIPACHRAAPATDSHSKKPIAKPCCCPAPVVAPAAPVVDKADATFTPIAPAVIATVISFASPTTIDLHGHRSAPDGQPPTRLTHAPAPARAPPLA